MQETPDHDGAYPRLSEMQAASLMPHGQRRRTERGDVLIGEGAEHYPFVVVIDGTAAVVTGGGSDDEQIVAVHGRRRFLGEISLLSGQAAFFGATVDEPGEVLLIDADAFRTVIARDAGLGDLVFRAFLLRRELLVGLGAGFRIVGSRFSPDTRRLREFAARNVLPHRWIDLEEDASADELLRHVGVSPEDTPVVVWRGEVLRNPSNAELARAVGLPTPATPEELFDLVIVGSGPAGLAAAVYGASEGLATVELDAVAAGGQAGTSSKIENYLGFPWGLSGAELAERATIQASNFGARFTVPAEATALRPGGDHYVVELDDGNGVAARTVLIATGAHYRRLAVPGLDRFEATNVYYAATIMEARVCAGDPVVVVGGGNSAGQATVFLSETTSRVYLLIRHDDLTRDMSRYLANRIERAPNVEVRLHTEVREIVGDDELEAMIVEDGHTGERDRIDARHLFVFIGADPRTDWLAGQVALDDHGFVLTGEAAATDGDARTPLPLESSLSGVLAVGDVRSGSVKRVASAVGEGAMAVRLVHEHLHAAGRA